MRQGQDCGENGDTQYKLGKRRFFRQTRAYVSYPPEQASLKSQKGWKGAVRALPGPWGEFPALLRWEEGAERPWR